MKILSTNHPIIVNGVRESKPSDYLSASGQDTPDDYYSADGMTDVVSSKNPIIINGSDISNPSWYLSAEGSRMSKARASNIEKRLAKLNREKANAQARIDKINARVSASGKPMGRVDENIVRGLTKQVARIQATIDNLLAMQSSSFSGDDYYGANGDDYYSIDGKNPEETKKFQDWLDNVKKIKWVGATNTDLTNGNFLNKGFGYGNFGASTTKANSRYGAEYQAFLNPVTNTQVQNVIAQAPVVPPNTNPTPNQVADAKKKGLFWDKVKGGWVYAKESGILDWVGNLFGLQPPPAFQPTQTTTTTGSAGTGGAVITDNEKGMSKTTKTLLYVGGALVLGFVIYTIAKPKK
jgi:hypothetical protein